MKYSVEHSDEVPKRRVGRRAVYPFESCQNIGDNFFVAGTKPNRMSCLASYWSNKMKCKFSLRSEVNEGIKGVRIWRTA